MSNKRRGTRHGFVTPTVPGVSFVNKMAYEGIDRSPIPRMHPVQDERSRRRIPFSNGSGKLFRVVEAFGAYDNSPLAIDPTRNGRLCALPGRSAGGLEFASKRKPAPRQRRKSTHARDSAPYRPIFCALALCVDPL
jgi:hypothetical protein